MSSPTISVRQLDENHDPVWGQGQANFLTDINAVAQIIQTRLLLLQGEWWVNLNEGLPVLQKMLGVGGSGKSSTAASLAIQQNIQGAPYVLGVSDVNTEYDARTRNFNFSCKVTTAFGVLAVNQSVPGSAATLQT